MHNLKFSAMILEVIKEGKIVPSEVTVKLIQKAISLGENHKFLIDGFPRTEENRLAYERIVSLASYMDRCMYHVYPFPVFCVYEKISLANIYIFNFCYCCVKLS